MPNSLKLLGSAALLALLGGCMSDVADPDEAETQTEAEEAGAEEVGSSEQEIRNGLWAPIPSADGYVDIMAEGTTLISTSRKRGSGILLGPRWVLTAGHNVDSSTIGGTPTKVEVRWGHITDLNAPTRLAQTLYYHPDHTPGFETSPDHPGDVDIALIRLASPIAGAVTRPISTAAWTTLSGTTLSCCGYAPNVEVGGAHGTLHCGAMPVLANRAEYATIGSNALGQIPLGGDSGGACNDVFAGTVISGVMTAISGIPASFAYVVPADRFRTWVQNKIAAVGP